MTSAAATSQPMITASGRAATALAIDPNIVSPHPARRWRPC
jgi:hypothetical protein